MAMSAQVPPLHDMSSPTVGFPLGYSNDQLHSMKQRGNPLQRLLRQTQKNLLGENPQAEISIGHAKMSDIAYPVTEFSWRKCTVVTP